MKFVNDSFMSRDFQFRPSASEVLEKELNHLRNLGKSIPPRCWLNLDLIHDTCKELKNQLLEKTFDGSHLKHLKF